MSSTNETVAGSPVPVDPRQRIEAVDMVRGFAFFGVLLRFGPMEWLWRALTYLNFPPMRLEKRSQVER